MNSFSLVKAKHPGQLRHKSLSTIVLSKVSSAITPCCATLHCDGAKSLSFAQVLAAAPFQVPGLCQLHT